MRGMLTVVLGLVVLSVVLLWTSEASGPAGDGDVQGIEKVEDAAVDPPEGGMAQGQVDSVGSFEARRSDVGGRPSNAGQRVRGRLVREGRPVEGVRVCLRNLRTALSQVQTGSDGRFALTASETGNMVLELLGPAATVI